MTRHSTYGRLAHAMSRPKLVAREFLTKSSLRGVLAFTNAGEILHKQQRTAVWRYWNRMLIRNSQYIERYKMRVSIAIQGIYQIKELI